MNEPGGSASWDIRDVVGMRRRGGIALASLFCLAHLPQIADSLSELHRPAFAIVAWIVLSLAVMGVVLLPGDPLKFKFALPIALCAPIGSALVILQLPELPTGSSQLWFNVIMLAPLVFMCVRGAVVLAWIGMLTQIAVVIYWAMVTGQGIGVGLMWTPVNVPPLLMATFFAYRVRPVARAIFALRAEANQRAAQQAAALAASEERHRALREVDALVRPMLERMASGTELTSNERAECLLLDAQLRDRIRGSTLVDEHVVKLATAARKRGVQVTLLDDGGLEGQPKRFAAIVRAELCMVLDRAGPAARVTARVHPPGRDVLATILLDHEEMQRIEVDTTGGVTASKELISG
ncbi:hypothetical protein ONR57_12970 [Hoyosella sp. YIM 151337]|uniref:hypothetical protein n=1 Tax=Hoyosella sp. YIM 151337 TaxID=2992742 RepID=UPI002236A465|nr:hypothetical protein [Hoyosella sp. YIM 151337]MCW4354212.1 hypothetical protein [Hoyosella sp. YIM 151337]